MDQALKAQEKAGDGLSMKLTKIYQDQAYYNILRGFLKTKNALEEQKKFFGSKAYHKNIHQAHPRGL